MTTTTITDLAALTPAEVDELWNEAMQPAFAAERALAETRRSIRRYERAGGYTVPEYLRERETVQAEKLAEARKASEPFDAEYERRGGWARYLIVVSSSNGHVHRGHGCCSALTPGVTLVSPVYALSGEDDEGVVVSQGYRACSKCFPSAPVETVADKRAAAVAAGACAGTGETATTFTSNRRYGRCPSCGRTVGVSQYGKVSRHKPDAA